MTFLSKIRGVFGGGDDHLNSYEEPVRSRTFSASQFREEELARAAEARARSEANQIDAAQVLSPAINPVAESLMAEESVATDSEAAEWEAPEPEESEVEEAEQEAQELAAAEQGEPSVEVAEPTAAEPEATEWASTEPEEADLDAVEATEVVPEAAPPAAPALPVDAMPWDEAVGWLSQRSAETRNFVGQYWNWDYDLRVLHFLAQQPDLDAGVAAHIFWITAASEDYFPFGDDEPDSEISQQVAWLTEFLGRRFAEKTFLSYSYGFDDSWDCERLKQRLIDLHEEGRLEWSAESIPTSSQAELMSFDDVPEEERNEVAEFLARFGVY
jgi:hypothetical protein